MIERLPVFFRPEQSCDVATSYSPSAGKPALVVADWQKHFGDKIQIETFNPAGDEVLCEAHDPHYVSGIMSGEIANGFRTHDLDVAHSMRYTVGSMLAAAKHVLTVDHPEERIACSPTSGFHHAGFDFGGGFCTLNGLMITAMRLKTLGLVKRVTIIDMDQHYGNGTQDIIEHHGIDWVDHITAEHSFRNARDVDSIMLTLKMRLHKFNTDLVLFQAGADIHVDDPLGGILTTEQMRQRDRQVFFTCQAYGFPLVWNLAGGYKRDSDGGIEPVLALHRQTMRECIERFVL